MSENADKTCTTFIIPANNKIAYMHEIKVEDYDEIYANKDDTVVYDEPVVEPVIEEAVVVEPAEKPVTEEVVAEEPAEEPVAEEAVTVDEAEEDEEAEEETADEVVESEEVDLGNIEITFEPEDMSVIEAEELAAGNGLPSFYNGRRCNYSFEAKLHLANSETRLYYSEIAAFIASYGLKINRSWSKERIQIGKKTYAMFIFKGLKLTVSFALDPAEYENTKYKLKDVSHVKKFSQVPAQMKITSLRKVKWVKELFTQMFTKEGIENKNLPVKVKPIRAKRRSELLKQNLIKIK